MRPIARAHGSYMFTSVRCPEEQLALLACHLLRARHASSNTPTMTTAMTTGVSALVVAPGLVAIDFRYAAISALGFSFLKPGNAMVVPLTICRAHRSDRLSVSRG